MYRVILDGSVDDQITALDRGGALAYAEVLALLEVSPLSGVPYNDALPDGPMRQVAFGREHGGPVTYLVLERDREVHILGVLWPA